MAASRLKPLAAALLWLLAAFSPASAQVILCPQMTAGWALQWLPTPTQTITSASYDTTTQLLYIVFNYKTVVAFTNVPIGIIISLSYTQNPTAIYNGSIVNTFTQATLNPKTNCPV